jgi:hypothetical protein
MTTPILKAKRGAKANLPAHELDGVLLVTRDTKELFMGQGLASPLIQIGEENLYNFNGVGQVLTCINGNSVQSAVINSEYVLINSEGKIYIATGLNPVAVAGCTPIQLGFLYKIKVGIGNKIAIRPIRNVVANTQFLISELL